MSDIARYDRETMHQVSINEVHISLAGTSDADAGDGVRSGTQACLRVIS
jgi:hypothetical protein